MPDGDRRDARAAMQLRRDWEPKRWDTGWAGGQWWALGIDDGEVVGPAATPADLDAMLQAIDRPRSGLSRRRQLSCLEVPDRGDELVTVQAGRHIPAFSPPARPV